MIKISRDTSIIKYRKFPLRSFEKDTEISYYPKIYSSNWFKLEHKSAGSLGKILSEQITELCVLLGIKELIFLCDFNRTWISKFTSERKDHLDLSKAVEYFTKHKVGGRFNGALKINVCELPEFIKHFYVVTRCDGGFSYYHFLDEDQKLLGFIHYSGDVCFETLNKEFEPTFLKEIGSTLFQNVKPKD